jgi:NAD(P)-dependent dehydrogenase (short-subunit alcohol dehydrogenase family)
MMGILDGKAAIVTAGAGPGMGSAFSRALAAEGAAVVIADIDAGRAEALAGEIRASGWIALAVPTDVANGAEVRSLVARTVAEFGGVGVLVNHAGVMPSGRLEDIT